MPRKEPIRLGEFLYLVSEEQKVMLLFSDFYVEGTQDSLSCVLNSEFNLSRVVSVEAADDAVKVWVECDENA